MLPLCVLTKNRYRLLRNTWRQGWGAWLKSCAGLLVSLAFCVAVFYGALAFFRFLGKALAETPPAFLSQLQLSILCSVALSIPLMLVVTGLRTAYETLFAAPDIAFLLTAPISIRTVFMHKALDVYSYAAALAAPLSLPVFWAFGASVQAPVAFYVTTTLAVLLGVVIVQSLVNLLLMLVMRYMPGKTLKQVFMGVAGAGALGIVIATQVLAARAGEDGMRSSLSMAQSLGQWGLDKLWYLPHVWITRAAIFPLPQFGFSGVDMALVALIAIGLLMINVNLASRLYLAGWNAEQESGANRRANQRRIIDRRRRWFTGMAPALIRKDLAGYRREPLLWYNLATGGIVLAFFAFNISRGGGRTASAGLDHARSIAVLMPALMAGVLSAQLGGMGISREGGSWWFIQTSPIQARLLYLAKLGAALLPAWLLSTAFTLLYTVWPGVYTYPLLWTLPGETLLVTAIVSLVLFLDILAPDFDFKLELGGRNQKNSGKMLIATFSSMIFIVLIAFLITSPGFYRKIPLVAGMNPTSVQILAIALAVVVNVSVIVIGLLLGSKRLTRLLVQP